MPDSIILFYLLLIVLAGLFLWLGTKWRWIYMAVIIPTFVIPGLLKLLDAHFLIDLNSSCKKMCDLSPSETAFYFFSYSRLFIRTAGFMQLVSGLLLLSKRYRFLGLLSCLVVSCFVNLLNISFWGISTVTIYMLTISVSIIVYLYKDYRDRLSILIKDAS